MAALVFSNSVFEGELINNSYKEAGFEVNNRLRIALFEVTTYDKKCVSNANFVQFENGDFVACSGTLIYNDKIGVESLQELYRDFNKNINTIRTKAFGNYLVCIKKENEVFLFVDKYGIYVAFYYADDDKFMVANNLFFMANSLKNMNIDKHNILEWSFQFCILDNGTLFNEIKRLQGDEFIKYDVVSNKLKLCSIERNLAAFNTMKSTDQMAKELASLIIEKAKVISCLYDDVTLNLTGGLDNRVVLASFLAVGKKPKVVYGVGNSQLTNTRMRDLELVKQYSNIYNLAFYQMDWSTRREGFVDDWAYLLQKYGDYFRTYFGNINVLTEYEKNVCKNTDFIEFGFFGETLRNTLWLEAYPQEHFTVDDFLKGYSYQNYDSFLRNSASFKSSIRDKLICLCKKESVDFKRISKDDYVKIHAYHRRSADARMVNLMNYFTNSISILSIPVIHEYILQVPFEYKKDAKFQLKLINYLCPSVLDVPIFSHTQNWVFDRVNFTMKRRRRDRLIDKLNETMPEGLVKKILAKALYLTRKNEKTVVENKKGLELRKELVKITDNLQKQWNLDLVDIDNYQGDLRNLTYYAQNLYMLKKLLLKSEGN